MEKTASQKIRLGVFVIIGLTLFVLAVYFIGNKQQMFGKTEQLTAVFNNVAGLQLGNNVRYSGINVGTVRGIEIVNDSTINVEMQIDKSVFSHIKKNAVATIGSDGLVGSVIINIIPGKGIAAPVVPGDFIRSNNRVRTDDMLNTLNVTNQNAARLTADLLKITNDIHHGKGTIGLLLRDSVMAKDLKETIHNLKITSQKTSQTMDNLNRQIAGLDNKDNVIGVLKDTVVGNKIRHVVTNLDSSSQEITKVVANLNATITNIKEGKGALNYLSNDPKLVKQIDSTMTNINQASKKLNENLEALKSNFLFRGYFKKQEKAKKKAAAKQ
ncbi:MlaD family protein [Flavobacterium sedimenticola]|uniref:MlaD family protein n=1 Tax=Flavobacterium sedimenticola TaxID=3043286 RepID=A0ABT6XPC8_9FLAO|nr:MlaD family protein [Flavobacterium sedimenticola]MDI9256945.1 MlaD family protein [Flavobacterium sedimenticola]